jgi:hypothetical protein
LNQLLLDPWKDRLKYKRASLARTKEIQAAMHDVTYKTDRLVGDIQELRAQTDQIQHLPDHEKAPLVKNILMSMIESLEGLEEGTKLGNSQLSTSNISHSKTFNKKLDSKSLRMDVLEHALEQDSDTIKQQIEEINRKNAVLKKFRVKAQKKTYELEKKLNFVEEEIGEDHQPEVENLEDLDLNKEATLTNQRYLASPLSFC